MSLTSLDPLFHTIGIPDPPSSADAEWSRIAAFMPALPVRGQPNRLHRLDDVLRQYMTYCQADEA